MSRKCSVPYCSNNVKFTFPTDPNVRHYWLDAINRPDFKPKRGAGLCGNHFHPSDIIDESAYTGVPLMLSRLKRGVVPSLHLVTNSGDHIVRATSRQEEFVVDQFPATTEPLQRTESLQGLCKLQFKNDELEIETVCVTVGGLDCRIAVEDKDPLSICVDKSCGPDEVYNCNVQTQTTLRLPPYTISDLKTRPEVLKDLTSIDFYDHFMFILYSLGPNIHNIRCRCHKLKTLSVEDQLFLTVWKLKKAATDVELGSHFGISQSVVSDTFFSFIKFMADHWSKLDLWPSKDLVNFFMPEQYKKALARSRTLATETEIQVEEPMAATAQQVVSCTLKNSNSIKMSHCSGVIVGKKTLDAMWDERNSVLAKYYSPWTVIRKDWKLASRRVHIKKLIGPAKVYRILRTRLSHKYVSIASEIFFVCVMLTNFKKNIVKVLE